MLRNMVRSSKQPASETQTVLTLPVLSGSLIQLTTRCVLAPTSDLQHSGFLSFFAVFATELMTLLRQAFTRGVRAFAGFIFRHDTDLLAFARDDIHL